MMSRQRDRSKESPEDATPDESTDVLAAEPEDDEGFTVDVAPETVPFSETADKPNPLEPAYVHSRDNATGEGKDAIGVQMRVPGTGHVFRTEDRANKALALVRKAAGKLEGGARTRVRQESVNGSEGFALYFAWRPRAVRKYSTDDVRTWARENGHGVPETGRVPSDVLTAYRKAHGYPTGPTAEDVRKWARENGHTVPAKGRIPKSVRDAYDAAHKTPDTPPAE